MAVGWGSKTAMTQLTTITTRQNFAEFITLEPNEKAHVEVEIDFPATPNDDAVVTVEATLDATSESWDEVPVTKFAIDEAVGDVTKRSFVLEGHYKYRIGVERISGGSETLTSADCNYRIGTMS